MTGPDLVLICGEEPYLVDESARAWRARAAGGQLDVEIFDQPTKLEALRAGLAEMPMFDPERVIIVRDPPQLSGSSKRGADSAEALAEALSLRAPTTAVCIVNHGAVAAGNPVRAAVTALGGQIIEHGRLRGRELRAFAEKSARERGVRLDSRSLDHVVAVAAPDLGVICAELDKLAAFAAASGGGAAVSHADVLTLVAGTSAVETWNVMEWLLGAQPGRGAAAMAALLDAGCPPPYLLVSIAGQVRELIAARALISEKRGGAADLAGALRLPSWRAERLARQARRIPGRLSVAWLHSLEAIDAASKSGDVDAGDALRGFALEAAAAVAALPA